MKILIFEQRYTRRDEAGIGRFDIFSQEWTASGHEIKIIAGMINYMTGLKPKAYRGKLWVNEKKDKVEVLRVFDSAIGYRSFLGRLFSYFSFVISAFIAGLFSEKPEVVIASSPPIFIGLLGYLVARLKYAKFVFEVRDLWPDEPIELGFLKNKILIKASHRLERFLYAKADSIVVNSPGIKDFLMKEKHVPQDKIYIIPNPVDLESFRVKPNSKDEFGFSDKKIVLYSGSMSAVYDLNLLLDIAKESDKNVVFLFIGDGRQKPVLIKRAKDENIDNVFFWDSKSKLELGGFIKMADVCVAPLKNKKLLKYVYATKVLDYMASGRSVVLGMSGVTEKLLCGEAEAGICVLPENKESFKRALTTLLRNENRGSKLGASGLAYVSKHFKPEVLAEEYLAAIVKTSNRTKGRA